MADASSLPIALASAPYVSILTPTYNREHFLKLLATMLYAQTYPLNRVEWVVIDDSETGSITWLEHHPVSERLFSVIYKHLDEHIPIGDKRNMCKDLSSGRIIIHMDDDDYYGPRYISKVVNAFHKHPEKDVVGASEIQLIYPHSEFVWLSGPFHPNHTCGATMSYRRRYADQNLFRVGATFAEEKFFLQDYKTPVLQLSKELFSEYFVVAHSMNTVNKSKVHRKQIGSLWASLVHHVEPLLKYYSICDPKNLKYLPHANMLVDKHINKILNKAVCNALMHFIYVVMTTLQRCLHRARLQI